jgi:hypothetical protein
MVAENDIPHHSLVVIWRSMNTKSDREIRAAAKVLAALAPGTVDVVLAPGEGMADGGNPSSIATAKVPPDLRTPNSEFWVVIDRDTLEIVRGERMEKTR